MDIHQTLHNLLFSSMGSDGIILTPNRRLSATLHKFYQSQQLSMASKYWSTPQILPILSWFESLWIELVALLDENLPLLLNTAQEQLLWKNILAVRQQSQPLLKIHDTTQLVQSAYQLLRAWHVDIHDTAFELTDDYMALREWILQYQMICEKHNWIDQAALPDELIKQLLKNNLKLPKKIVLFGFTELSPQLQQFFAICSERDKVITQLDWLNPTPATANRMTFILPEDELYRMAEWAHTLYQSLPSTHANVRQSGGTDNTEMKANITIGCVIPHLDKIRDRVSQIFAEVFAETNEENANGKIYNISAGKKLTQYPIIHAIFQLLTIKQKTLSADLIWFLLSSPFIGDAEAERNSRASLDFVLRQENMSWLNLTLPKHQTLLAKYCPKLHQRIENVIVHNLNGHSPMSHEQWVNYFNKQLTLMGWPGERSLNSEEFQTVDNWLKLLNQYRLFDRITGAVHLSDALQTLHDMANRHIFQPKTPEAPIQILGILEAAALPFDYLWIANMDDLNWPPQPRPNPFIPRQLQRQLKMPHATAERELQYCEQITEQFKHSATNLIFSYACKNNDTELQVSPLIANLPEVPFAQVMNKQPCYQTLSQKIFATQKIETLLDENASEIMVDEIIRGGINMINYQSTCPFRAFSECRLHARELQLRKLGMRAQDRGTLVHKVLEIVWKQLRDHETLIGLTDIELDNVINHCIDDAFQMTNIAQYDLPRYMQLERQRLLGLIKQWLAIEKTREPFKVIATEQATQITLNQINLSIKIDRIDAIDKDGKYLIIDYKTGKHNDITAAFDERPEEIQLPLYALTHPDKVAGITYAQVTARDCKFKGVSHADYAMKGIKAIDSLKKGAENWQEQILRWQEQFNRIADDFARGVAKVDPKDKEKTCLHCALKSLCRIHEEINLTDRRH